MNNIILHNPPNGLLTEYQYYSTENFMISFNDRLCQNKFSKAVFANFARKKNKNKMLALKKRTIWDL